MAKISEADKMDLSIVIPVYNEAKKIRQDLEAAETFLQQNSLSGEIIVSDDGSSDRTGAQVKQFSQKSRVSVLWISDGCHRGKGAAVRTGILAASSRTIAFMDSGSCVPYNYLKVAMERLVKGNCDVVHGSRYLPESRIVRSQPLSRRMFARLFRKVVTRWYSLPGNFSDTQCGFKVYKGDVAHRLYSRCRTNGFLFDIEVILLALQDGYRICEIPIEWHSDPDSRLSLLKNAGQILWEMIALRIYFGKKSRRILSRFFH